MRQTNPNIFINQISYFLSSFGSGNVDKKLIIVFLVFGILFFSGCLIDGKPKVSVNVSSSDGESLEGAAIIIKTRATNTVISEGVTDSQGKWETELTEGDYTIKISKEGYGNTYLKDKTIGSAGLVIGWTLSIENQINEETIYEILAKAENIESLEYIHPLTNGKVFFKGEKFRIEDYLPGISVIFNGTKQFKFDYETGTCTDLEETTIPEQSSPLKYFEDLIDFVVDLEQMQTDSSLEETGTEEVQGFNTRVIKFTKEGLLGTEKIEEEITLWVSEEYGIPIKIKSEILNASNQTIEIEFKEIEFNSVDGSVFECKDLS